MSKKHRRRDWGKAIPWVALAIALSSLGVDALQWFDSRAEKARQLEVKFRLGRVDIKGGAEHREGLILVAVNSGHQTVRLIKGGIFLPDGPPFPYSSPYKIYSSSGKRGFPCFVNPDDNLTLTLSGSDLKRFCDGLVAGGRDRTVMLVGFFIRGSDFDGRSPYKSKELEFDIQKGLKLARSQIKRTEPVDVDGIHKSKN